ncbi:unnamed protein product [Ceutorhynchus assimilis]|uniref:1-alkyl-2-acetylglycerophosphocholine esterase n=1 Tax=Ceutorhynchus assimilis TaxID=467358 RepID=A0A9N9QG25_9CUCU|nr:unnamed protein product [Ceutorhynchus assimilis]
MVNHLPLPAGPFAPGMVDVLLDYKKDAPFLRLYYPTNEKPNPEKWISWLPDDDYLTGLAKVIMVYKCFLKLLLWWSGNIKIPAIYGAKPKTDEPLKCIILSHGLGGTRFLYTNICCELASRGFLIAALEHRDQSACHTFYYSTKADAEADKKTSIDFRHIKFGRNHYTKRNEQIKLKFDECSKTLDFLLELQQGIVPSNIMDATANHTNIQFNLNQLKGNLDVSNVCIMGHSFGGATALYALSKRKELKLGILLDPWMFPIKNEALDIEQPLLFINTQTFHIAPNVDAMAKFVAHENAEMYTIRHTTHENQTDSVLLMGYWLNWFMKKLNPLLALKINNSLILKFLNKHIAYKNIEDCIEILEKEKFNIDEGLTQPWA